MTQVQHSLRRAGAPTTRRRRAQPSKPQSPAAAPSQAGRLDQQGSPRSSWFEKAVVTWVATGLGVMFVLIGLIQFGAWPMLRQLVTSGGGKAGPVLLWLALGAACLTVAVLGRQVFSGAMKWPLAIVVYLLIAWLVLSNDTFFLDANATSITAEGRRLQGVTFGIISVLFLLVVTGLLAKGATGRAMSRTTSTGPSVILLWSAVVVYAIAFIAAVALTTGGVVECPIDNPATAVNEALAPSNCVVGSAWTDYLLLLGLPGVAAALAKSQGSEDRSSLSASSAATDELTEVQFLVFNAIAMTFVVWSLVTHGVLGHIPDVLLGLTGASALSFSLAKRLPATTGNSSGTKAKDKA